MKKQVHLPFVSKQVEDLVLWRSPKESGLVFGSATAVFMAYTLNPFSASTIMCYTVAITSLAAFLWAQMGNFVSKAGPPVPAFLARGLSEDEAHKFTDTALPILNKAFATIGVLASGKDLKMSLLVFSGAYAAARIFDLISPVTLAFIVVLAAFTLPKVYELKHEEVDKVLAAAKAKADEVAAKLHDVVSKIPKASAPKKAQ